MSSVIRQLFDLRPGEGRLVWRSAMTLFGLIAAHTMLETARDTLFLGKLPVSNLGMVYALLAIVSFFLAQANNTFVHTFGRRNSLIVTLLLASFGNTVFYLLPPQPAIIFALYIWSGLLGSVLVVQFWMLVGHTYTVSQGKRLFGLLASGGVLGAVVGASLSVAILNQTEVQELILIATFIFLLTAFYSTGEPVDNTPKRNQNSAASKIGWNNTLQLFSSYPYLLRLALLVSISTAAVLATDYLFKAVAASTHAPEDLGRFFAQYYAVLNSAALLVQVLVASTLVQRAGVIGAFMLLPSLLVVGGGLSLLIGGGTIIFVTKGADGALRHSLHRISSELLWMPLPESVRTQAKTIVDTVVVRSSQALIAGLLIFFASLELDSPRHLSGLVLLLAVGWLVLALGLRRPYLDLFRSALTQPSTHRLELDLRSVEVVVEALSSRDPASAIAAIDLLHSSDRARLIPALILYHEADEVLLRALEVIPQPDRSDWVPLAERLLQHEHEQIRVAALIALAKNGLIQHARTHVNDISPWVRAHAAFWIVQQESSLEHPPERANDIGMLLEIPAASGAQAREGLLDAIAQAGDTRWANLVFDLAQDANPAVVRAAIRAMQQIADTRYIPILINHLAIRDGRDNTQKAIVSFGHQALQALIKTLNNPKTPSRILLHIPGTIARFKDKHALSALEEAIEQCSDGRVRFKILRALVSLTSRLSIPLNSQILERRMVIEVQEYIRMKALRRCLLSSENLAAKSASPDEALKIETQLLLLGLLKDKQKQAHQRIWSLLQVGYPTEDINAVRVAAKSEDRQKRAQAQEFLDALTLRSQATELRPLLRLLADDLSEEEFIARASTYISIKLPDTISAAFKELLDDPDQTISRLTQCVLSSKEERILRSNGAIHEEHQFESLIRLFPGFSRETFGLI